MLSTHLPLHSSAMPVQSRAALPSRPASFPLHYPNSSLDPPKTRVEDTLHRYIHCQSCSSLRSARDTGNTREEEAVFEFRPAPFCERQLRGRGSLMHTFSHQSDQGATRVKRA
ncbi:hypothetical protein WMY93_020541 [Mugilogobius chulae]|uniref:Uncharacterized protein n=1 Tax=Mugilogobius chulae TaxID=88201 RepID=A0AAW0NDY5_9GOBI